MRPSGYNRNMTSDFSTALLAWYQDHGRDLPWRHTRDPYAIWVAEVMLQQTQVDTVMPFYERWMQRFPTVQTLAQAAIDQVLAAWEGLGYYRRAHGLLAAARLIDQQLDGRVPDSEEALNRLPGIGPYTAAAVAAIAFKRDTIALDSNLKRVLARIINLESDIARAESMRSLGQAARAWLPRGQAAAFNQALMDLGAIICTPRFPACDRCPVARFCQAQHLGLQAERPVRSRRNATPVRQEVAAVVHFKGAYLIRRRPDEGLLAGLYEFPRAELRTEESPAAAVERLAGELGMGFVEWVELGKIRHAYTHFRAETVVLGSRFNGEGRIPIKEAGPEWVDGTELADKPMGKIDRTIANLLLQASATGSPGQPRAE
jgi:A/G-specific adenine glycosylase